MKPLHPIIKGFDCEPMTISLGDVTLASLSQEELNERIKQIHAENGVTWSISGDRENRYELYRHNASIMREGRTVHIGLDVNVPLGTPIYAPFDGEVVKSEYEAGSGNYGWLCVLKCNVDGEVRYIFFGHMAQVGLAVVGSKLAAGDIVGYVGDFHENGNYFHHLHLQVLTQRGFDEGWVYRALCRAEQLSEMDELCPSPLSLVK